MTEETRGKVQGAPARLTVGTRFAGQYDVTGVLGAGGMGVVYEATRVADAEPIALKVLHRHLVANTQVIKRFHREAGFLRRLSGPSLVPILDAGEDEDGRLFMALARVYGEPLDVWLQTRGIPPVEVAAAIVAKVAEALALAHASGIVHRDLKPANIMLEHPVPGVDPDRSEVRVRVLDFGLAKALGEHGVGLTVLTERNMVFGTPEYMAPEQVQGDEVDGRTDVYALGVVLFELLSGRVPFALATGVATMSAQITEAPPSIRHRAPDRAISPALAAVVRRCLAKRPDDRFPSALALKEALLEALAQPGDQDDDPPEASSLLPSSSAATPRRVSIPVPSVDGEVVDPLAATAQLNAEEIFGRRPLPPTPTRNSQTRTPDKGSRAWIFVFILAAAIGIGLGLWVGR
jgi:eukaryotic-like serine/threonine-protein kinase